MKKTINLNGIDIEVKFKNGFAVIEMNKKYNFVDSDGKLLSPNQWFDNVSDFRDGGVAFVMIGKKADLINKEGKLIFKDIPTNYIEWYDDERYHRVYSESGMAYFKPNGEFAFDNVIWFDSGNRFLKKDKLIGVCKNSKWNLIDADGNFLFKDWTLDYIETFSEGFAMVELYGKKNYINKKGELLCKDIWFDEADDWFHGEYACVKLYGEDYLIDKKGKLYKGKWYKSNAKEVEVPTAPTFPKTLK